jgi:hypothetical protein
MAVNMEGTKPVAAEWLARQWRPMPLAMAADAVPVHRRLSIVNATGVCAQLVGRHQGKSKQPIADLYRRIAQIDGTVEEATHRGKTSGALIRLTSNARDTPGIEARQQTSELARLQVEQVKSTSTDYVFAIAFVRP